MAPGDGRAMASVTVRRDGSLQFVSSPALAVNIHAAGWWGSRRAQTWFSRRRGHIELQDTSHAAHGTQEALGTRGRRGGLGLD